MALELEGIDEFKGLKLTPLQIKFVMNYLSPSCGYDANKAYRLTIGDDVFKTMSKGTFYGAVRKITANEDVKKALSNLLTKEVEQKKEVIIPLLLNDLILAADYDPAQIIDDDGDMVHGALSDIPQKLRRAVIEGITIKYWGKDCEQRTREVKLTSKTKARSQLLDLYKVYVGLQGDNNGGNVFNVSIGTSNIEGMATADELFKMSVVGHAEKVEE